MVCALLVPVIVVLSRYHQFLQNKDKHINITADNNSINQINNKQKITNKTVSNDNYSNRGTFGTNGGGSNNSFDNNNNCNHNYIPQKIPAYLHHYSHRGNGCGNKNRSSFSQSSFSLTLPSVNEGDEPSPSSFDETDGQQQQQQLSPVNQITITSHKSPEIRCKKSYFWHRKDNNHTHKQQNSESANTTSKNWRYSSFFSQLRKTVIEENEKNNNNLNERKDYNIYGGRRSLSFNDASQLTQAHITIPIRSYVKDGGALTNNNNLYPTSNSDDYTHMQQQSQLQSQRPLTPMFQPMAANINTINHMCTIDIPENLETDISYCSYQSRKIERTASAPLFTK